MCHKLAKPLFKSNRYNTRKGRVGRLHILDSKKAFDKVPLEKLLWKLENVGGLKGVMRNWMKDDLSRGEMRTAVKDEKSEWREVTSGVPQGSVFAPVMFLIYINDMQKGINSYMSLFADDAKLMKEIKDQRDSEDLQEDIDKIHKWNKTWEMEFNIKKCHVLEMGESKMRPTWIYKLGNDVITKQREENDLGVVVQDDLSPEKHISTIFGNAYGVLRNIRMTFHFMDKDMKKILATMIRPKLEYAEIV